MVCAMMCAVMLTMVHAVVGSLFSVFDNSLCVSFHQSIALAYNGLRIGVFGNVADFFQSRVQFVMAFAMILTVAHPVVSTMMSAMVSIARRFMRNRQCGHSGQRQSRKSQT